MLVLRHCGRKYSHYLIPIRSRRQREYKKKRQYWKHCIFLTQRGLFVFTRKSSLLFLGRVGVSSSEWLQLRYLSSCRVYFINCNSCFAAQFSVGWVLSLSL